MWFIKENIEISRRTDCTNPVRIPNRFRPNRKTFWFVVYALHVVECMHRTWCNGCIDWSQEPNGKAFLPWGMCTHATWWSACVCTHKCLLRLRLRQWRQEVHKWNREVKCFHTYVHWYSAPYKHIVEYQWKYAWKHTYHGQMAVFIVIKKKYFVVWNIIFLWTSFGWCTVFICFFKLSRK